MAGYTNASGNSFNGTNIDKILRNEKYTGVYLFTYNKGKFVNYEDIATIRIEDGLPQIVSRETFKAVQSILNERIHRSPENTVEDYLLSGKVFCGECGTPYSGARAYKHGKKYVFYKCNWHSTYKNGKRIIDYCRNTTVRKDDMEKYVIKQILKIISHESIIDQVLAEYNKYAAEIANNASLVEMLENQIKDIDKQITNIINAVATTGNFNDLLQKKLNSLENDKNQIIETLKHEKKGCAYLAATKDELRRAYKKAQDILLNGSFLERRAILQMFLNKVIIFKHSVEIYINLIPVNLSGGLDLGITQQDFLAKISDNSLETIENSKKDGDEPSFSMDNVNSYPECFHRETVNGTPNDLSLYNSENFKRFAWFDGKVYIPRRTHKGQILSRKERLWLFMTVRTAIEKRMMLHLEFVKHSSL